MQAFLSVLSYFRHNTCTGLLINIQPFKIMRVFTFTFLILILSHFTSFAQEKAYKASMDGWLVDLNEAYNLSEKTGLPIMANFTGTDWCGWCIRLKNSVFLTDEFKKWAKKNVILLELDFPRRFKLPDNIAQQNASLQQAFQVRGYPTIWVFKMDFDPKTKNTNIQAMAKAGYMATPAEFIKSIETQIEENKNKSN